MGEERVCAGIYGEGEERGRSGLELLYIHVIIYCSITFKLILLLLFLKHETDESNDFKQLLLCYKNKSLTCCFVGESCHIQLDLCIDKATAPAMNLGTKKIEDILVLHLKGGKDFFVSFQKFCLLWRLFYL